MKKIADYLNETPKITRLEWIIVQFILGITAVITFAEWLK